MGNQQTTPIDGKKKQSTSSAPQPAPSVLPAVSESEVASSNTSHEELDETERWKERNVVLTSLDHEENIQLVNEVFGDVLKEVDNIVKEHEKPVINVTSTSNFKDHPVQLTLTPEQNKHNEILGILPVQEHLNLEVPKTLKLSDGSGIHKSVKSAEFVSCTSYDSLSCNDSFSSPCSPINDEIFHTVEENANKFANDDIPEELKKLLILPPLAQNAIGNPDRNVKFDDILSTAKVLECSITREDVNTEMTSESLIHETVSDPLAYEQNNSCALNKSFVVENKFPTNEINSNVAFDLNETQDGVQTEAQIITSFEQQNLDVSSSDEQYFMAPDSFEKQTEDIDSIVSVVLDQLKEMVVKSQFSEESTCENTFVALNDTLNITKTEEDISCSGKNESKECIDDFILSCPESESFINESDDSSRQLFSAPEFELKHTLPTLIDVLRASNESLGSENKLIHYCSTPSENKAIAEKCHYGSSDHSTEIDTNSTVNVMLKQNESPYKETVHLEKENTFPIDDSKGNIFPFNNLEISSNVLQGKLQNSFSFSDNTIENDAKHNFTCEKTEPNISESVKIDKTFHDSKEEFISDHNNINYLDQAASQLINSTEFLPLDVKNAKQGQANNSITQQLNANLGSEQKNELLATSNQQIQENCNESHTVPSHETFRDLTDYPLLPNVMSSALTSVNASSKLLIADICSQNESALFSLHNLESELQHEELSPNQINSEINNSLNSSRYQESMQLKSSNYENSDCTSDLSCVAKDEKNETNRYVTSDIIDNETDVLCSTADENEQANFLQVELPEKITEPFSELKLSSDWYTDKKERCANENSTCVASDILDTKKDIPYPIVDENINFQNLECSKKFLTESFPELKSESIQCTSVKESDMQVEPCNNQEAMIDKNNENFAQSDNLSSDSNISPLLLIESKSSSLVNDCNKFDVVVLDNKLIEQQMCINSNANNNLDAFKLSDNKEGMVLSAENCSFARFEENNFNKSPLQVIDKNLSSVLDQKALDTLENKCIKQPKDDGSQNLHDNAAISSCDNVHETATKNNLKIFSEENYKENSLNQLSQTLVVDSDMSIVINSEIDFASTECTPIEQKTNINTQDCEQLKNYENQEHQNIDKTDSSKNILNEKISTQTRMPSAFGTTDNTIPLTNLSVEDSCNDLFTEDVSHDETLCTSEQDKTIVNSENMSLCCNKSNDSVFDNVDSVIPIAKTDTISSYQSPVGECDYTFSFHNVKENNDQQNMPAVKPKKIRVSPISKIETDFLESKSLQNKQNLNSLDLFSFSPDKENKLEPTCVKVEETGNSECNVNMPCQLGECSSASDMADNKSIGKKIEIKNFVDRIKFDVQNDFGSLQEALLKNIDSFSQKHILDASCSAQADNDSNIHDHGKEQEMYKHPSEKQENNPDTERAFSATQFTEGEFRSAAEFFKDPSAFEFLQKAGSTTAFQESCLGRMSLFLKFDPLLTGSSGQNEEVNCNIVSGESIPIETQHSVEGVNPEPLFQFTPKKSQDCKNQLIDISCTPVKAVKTFTEEEMNQGLKMQELLYQEKLINKDKEFTEQIKNMEKEKDILRSQTETVKDIHIAARGVISELLDMMRQWVRRKEEDRFEFTISKQSLTKERDQALEDLQSVEKAFSDLIRRYENAKTMLETMKQNERAIKQQVENTEKKLQDQEKMYDLLRVQAEEKIELANSEILSAKKEGETELAVVKALLRKEKMKTSTLEKTLEQTVKENTELSSICDELITKVGN